MKTENNLSYSIEALRVKSLFYGKKAMVYVEGPDDVAFWDCFFDRSIFAIQNVGGCSNLTPFIDKLEHGELSFIVACDSDYRSFTGESFSSPLIVSTYGHSIENMMYCPFNINEFVKKLSRSADDSIDIINKWYSQFSESCKPLLFREIVNLTYKPSEDKIKVLGINCAKFCKSNPCYELDDSKIEKYCSDNDEAFPHEEIERVKEAVTKDGREVRQLIRGHFYTFAVMRLISSLSAMHSATSKKINLSDDILYSSTVHCDRCCHEDCIDKKYINMQIELAIQTLEIATA